MDNRESEIRNLSRMIIVEILTIFSFILVVFNILLGWEKWTLPLILMSGIGCIMLHVSQRLTAQVRTYIFSFALFVEIFYYCAKIGSLYDCVPVVITAMVVFVMLQDKSLTYTCLMLGSLAVIWNVLSLDMSKIVGNLQETVRVLGNVGIAVAAGIIVMRYSEALLRTEEKYEEEIRKLKEENKSAGDFLANVSHEIRTPVNAVIGLSKVCVEKTSDDNVKDAMNTVMMAGEKVAYQISDILDYSEIESKVFVINEEDYNICKVVSEVVQRINKNKPEGLELIADIDVSMPQLMRSDVTKIRKILWHTITNGLKYTAKGGVCVRVYTVERNYGVNLCIDVADTGIGMDEDELERIFDNFYQVDSGRTRGTGGLGLGLPIIDGYVRALKGFVVVDSKPEDGTFVSISLPQKVIDKKPCMTMKNMEEVSIGAYFKYENIESPYIREFYNNALNNMSASLNVPVKRTENKDLIRNMIEQNKMSHLIIGQKEYLEDRKTFDKLAHKIPVFLIARDRSMLPPDICLTVMEKPFITPVLAEALNEGEAVGATTHKLFYRGIKALVVDDERINIMVAKGIMERYGIEIDSALSGEEAIEKCDEERYDLVFMDYMMPKMDGIEAMKRIRAGRPGMSEMPIVALTANVVSAARERFIKEGFDAFLSKPIDTIELEYVLRKMLPARAMVSEGDDANLDFISKARKAGLDVNEGMKYCMGDKKFYEDMIKAYVAEYTGKRIRLEECIANNKWDSYLAGIKSIIATSKLIGLGEIESKARALETAILKNDMEYINEYHIVIMQEYGEYVEKLQII